MWRRIILPDPGLHWKTIQALVGVILLTACGSNSASPTEPGALTAYQTRTPGSTQTLEMGSLPAETPLASPTPFTHIIQAGDTMGALAQKFGVSLDALIAANPGVSPNAMPIGAALLHPHR